MSAGFAFVGMLLLSLVVAILVALQLGDFFRTGDELLIVIAAVAVFATGSVAVFAAGHAFARRAGVLGAIAAGLAMLAVALVYGSGLVGRIAERSANPHTVGVENTYIALELLVPALIAVLLQWGLVRRRWLRMAGAEELARWPWVTSVVAGLVILNPIGLDFLSSALRQSPTDWLAGLATMIAAAAMGVLVVMGLIECYIRGRILRRRLEGT
jgi:hypothetical protein